MISDILAQFFGEILCYGTGKVLVSALTPHIRVSRIGDAPSRSVKRSWFALTYKQDGVRYYYDETITFIGLLFWLLIGATALLGTLHHFDLRLVS